MQIPRKLSSLGFSIIKTEEQFRSAYAMHDLAIDYAARQYLRSGFAMYPLGVDLREHGVIIENELPDYMAEKGTSLFCFDAKSKSSTATFGWVNERAAISYRKLAKQCCITIYLIFVQVVAQEISCKTGYCSIEDELVAKSNTWDGNSVWIFHWKEGLPHLR